MVEDALHRGEAVLRQERGAAGEHLIEEDPQGEEVRPGIGRLAARLLGRHHPVGAEDRSFAGQRLFGLLEGTRRPPRDAEVGDLRSSVDREQHVLGLEIAVHHALPVGAGEPFGEGEGNGQSFGDRQRPRLQEPVERGAGHVLHHDVVGAAFAEQVVDLHDSRMAEARGHPRLAQESRPPSGIRPGTGPGFGTNPLDRHLAVEPRIVGEEHLSHAPRAEAADHPVGPDRRWIRIAHDGGSRLRVYRSPRSLSRWRSARSEISSAAAVAATSLPQRAKAARTSSAGTSAAARTRGDCSRRM